MTQQEELKPCPFCGGKSYKHENKSGAVSRYIIECYDCRASSAYDAHEVNLIKKWNTRATPDIANFIEACDRRAEQKMLKTGKIEGAHYAVMREFAAEMGVYLPPPKFSLIVKNHDQPDHTEVLKMARDALEKWNFYVCASDIELNDMRITREEALRLAYRHHDQALPAINAALGEQKEE